MELPMASNEPKPTVGPSFVAPVVLVTGVVSGLLLVIALLFCKYCVKKNHCPRLQAPTLVKQFRWGQHGVDKSHQYESVASTVSAEQTTPQVSVCTKTSDSGKTSNTRRLDNEIDAAVAEYRERLKSFDGEAEVEDIAPVHCKDRQLSKASSLGSQGDMNRRVSFILADEKGAPKDSIKSSPVRNSRYTEGDFHHLKSARIDRPSLSSLRSLSDKEASVDEVISELTPMLSPVTEELPVTTQIQAEVHANPNTATKEASRDTRVKDSRYWEKVREISQTIRTHKDVLSPNVRVQQPRHMLALLRNEGRERQSASLELCTPHERWVHERRKVKSYEEDFIQKRKKVVDYDRSSITEFDKSIMCSTDFSNVIVGLYPEVPSKARYNDIGSFEDISDSQVMEELPGLIDSETETVNGTHTYKELWQLRSTLEEDEELSDTVHMENMTSPDMTSPDEKEPITSLTTSFESNTEPVLEQHHNGTEYHKVEKGRRGSTNLLHPNYEHKRRTYQFSKRSRSASERTKPGENSFDSFETMDTDGDVSESSRQEVTTTSFESTGTTDNTDSTGDSASHKLQQMRGDSGYKSLETQQSQTNADTQTPSTTSSKRHIHFVLTEQTKHSSRSSSLPETHTPTRHHYSRSHYFDRRAVKSASKKRREFRSDKQNLKVQECVREGESDSKSDQPSGDSFEEAPRKFSIFAKVGRSRSDQSPRRGNLSRDYSVDEKTDALFNEFMRFDPVMERTGHSSPKSHRAKLMRKNSEAIEGVKPKMSGRSASVDHTSLSSARKLKSVSPQDSIEEECAEVEQIMKKWTEQDEAAKLSSKGKPGDGLEEGKDTDQQHKASKSPSSKAATKVPIIRLYKQETTEV